MLAFVLTAGSAYAWDGAVNIDIPAQPMSTALRELSRQTGANVLFLPPIGATLISQAVKQRTTPVEAARQLVGGAALEVLRDPTGALIIRRQRPPTAPSRPVGSAPLASPAAASAPRSPPRRAVMAAAPPLLEEVVVTATRQLDTVNRVPLSISAQTQKSMDQQGVRTIADLGITAPALSVVQGAPGIAFLSIRGIQNNGQGAATTGFYLDDTPITKRGAFGCGICTGNGTPIPPLFDLERIEVLRGPQGTLFGSGSEGGTVRFITPQPGLTGYSVYGRAEASTTWNGDPSVEAGAAVGGPVVRDRLGLRVSLFRRQTGGWLDYRDRLSNQLTRVNANRGESTSLRAALLWAPNASTKVTAAYLSARDHYDSQSNSYYLSRDLPITEPAVCYGGTVTALADCDGPDVAFKRPAATYAPNRDLGRHTSLDPFLAPSTTNTQIASLTLDYDLGAVSFKSITSYIDDQTKLINTDPGSQIRTRTSRAMYGDFYIPRGLQVFAGVPTAYSYGRFFIDNRRYGVTQEFRVRGGGAGDRLNWVGGLFYSNLRNTQRYDNIYFDLDALSQALYGLSATQRYRGTPPYLVGGAPIGFDAKRQKLKDIEIAAFGEANLALTSRLQLTAGVRISSLTFQYSELHYGPASGSNDPASIVGGATPETAITEAPVAPKFGLQYQLGADKTVYGVVARGFRAGGVNSSIPAAVCGPQLALYGLTVNDLPPTYDADTVWSYEVGAKLRLADNRVQLNASAYRIDWSNIQTVVTIPGTCGIPFTTNAGAARSDGFEIEAQGRVAPGLVANVAIAHVQARYTDDALVLGAPGAPLVLPAASRGVRFPVSPWTVQLGARYDHKLSEDLTAYVRGDWWFSRGYSGTATQVFGQGSYAPDNRYPDTQRMNLRIGVERGAFDINLFALNLFNAREGIVVGGRNSCPTPPAGDKGCGNPTRDLVGATYNPFFSVAPATTPRQVGLQITYRH